MEGQNTREKIEPHILYFLSFFKGKIKPICHIWMLPQLWPKSLCRWSIHLQTKQFSSSVLTLLTESQSYHHLFLFFKFGKQSSQYRLYVPLEQCVPLAAYEAPGIILLLFPYKYKVKRPSLPKFHYKMRGKHALCHSHKSQEP